MKEQKVGGLGAGLAAGAALGAGIMYLWDPAWGRRRRSVARDKAVRSAHGLQTAAARTAADVSHRARGLRARLRRAFGRGAPDDRVLEQRVRSRLGRVCSHPHAIDVFAQDGLVELSGPILTSELSAVLREVGRVRGTTEVKNLLERHDRAGAVPSLQGAPPMWEGRRAWTPTGRLLAGAAGAGLLGASLRLQSPLRYGAGAAGLSLLARSLTNRGLLRPGRLRADRELIQVEKTFTVFAPIPEVFALWSKFEDFPRFLSHVREVRRTDDGNYRWEVTGPLGTTVAWTAEVSGYIPNRAIAWRSLPGSAVEMQGQVRFRPDGPGTRVELRLAYRPPAGSLGHGIAKLLGADPRKQIDDDIIRFKSLLEDGKATGGRETVDRETLLPTGTPDPEVPRH